MANEDEHSAFADNLLENLFDLFFDDELEKKGMSRDDFRKGRVFLKNPFAGSQMEELESADDSEVDVRVNDDAEIKLVAKLKAGRSVEKGEPLTDDDLTGFEEVILTEEQEDYGHITVADVGVHGYYINFDLRRNRSYYQPLLEAADQFIDTATYAKENRLWRAFVENAFHGAERMMKLEIIHLGRKAEKHSQVQHEYGKIAENGRGGGDLYDVYNKLKDKYRYSAGYVDPAGNVEEKTFEFSEELAEEFLKVIEDYREELDENGFFEID